MSPSPATMNESLKSLKIQGFSVLLFLGHTQLNRLDYVGDAIDKLWYMLENIIGNMKIRM